MESLPNELLAIIASHATAQSLKALHRVCRSISAGTSKAYYATFYAVRSHAFTRTGLKTLVNILSYPHLLQNIKSIQIVPLQWRRDHHWTCRGFDHALETEAFNRGTLESFEQLRHIIQVTAARHDLLQVVLSQSWPYLLIGSPPGQDNHQNFTRREFGAHTALEFHNKRCHLHLDRCMESLALSFQMALVQSADSIDQGLSLDLRSVDTSTPRWLLLGKMELDSKVYQNLVTLRLPALESCIMSTIDEYLHGASQLQYLAFELAKANRLTRLESMSNSQVLSDLTAKASCDSWPQLRRLEIGRPSCLNAVQNLLKTCPNTLQRLDFTNVDCRDLHLNRMANHDPAAWKSLCSYIQASSRVTTFTITFRTYDKVYRRPWGYAMPDFSAQETELTSQAAAAVMREPSPLPNV